MDIQSFKNYKLNILKDKDENERIIGYTIINNLKIIGRNNFYPNVLLNKINTNEIINPYDEKVMSLNKESFYDNNKYNYNIEEISKPIFIENEVFFFIYNFDNYFHYLYDTLPYLYTYLELKKNIKDLKLLINYPNKDKKNFYKFNTDFLYKLVNKEDIIIHNNNNIYNKIFVSTSLTHSGLSNKPPRKEIFNIYEKLKENIDLRNIHDRYKNLKNIYISRRTWLNKDKSNIGTDYTSRRKMINETELVNELSKLKFVEIFAENLNSDEKIYLFSNAEKICGSIGGGMANLLFCNKNTKSFIIVSPFFLDINYRFKYSLENSNFEYFYDTNVNTINNCKLSLYIRVKITNKDNTHYNKIGEIIEGKDDIYKIALSNNDVAGFNNNILFEKYDFNIDDFEILDKGLNSPYIFNYKKLIEVIFTNK